MSKKALAVALIILTLTSHFSAALTFRVYATEGTDALTALKFIEEELKKGEVPSSSITEACFIIPEGFPVNLTQRLWFLIAQLISTGCTYDELRQIIKDANNTLKLPARISYELKGYTIVPEYDRIFIRRGYDGSVSVGIPYKVVDKNGIERDASSIKYESNGTNLFHVLLRYPKRRTYSVRRVDPDSYTLTFMDLDTGKVFNKTARINIGLFSNISQGPFFKEFLVAVPGHFEDTQEVVRSQVSEFRVLLPAHDPIVVDTSISSTRVGIGDTITITAQIRNPQEARGCTIMLGVKFSDKDAFEAWAPPPGSAYLIAPLYLRAKKYGTYSITIYFVIVEPSNLDVVFWNGGKTVMYTVEVLKPPRLEIKLLSKAISKFADLTITLINKGGGKATNVKLFITGDVDKKELKIGTIVGLWSMNVVTKLLSPIARINVTAVYYDEYGKRYSSTALTTISITNLVTPEQWRNYVVEVKGYNETKRVFVPGHQGATHVKLYFMATDLVPEHFGGARLIPISPDGFTLTLGNASDVTEAARALNAKYLLIDVKPGFLYEKIMYEDEVKKLFSIGEDERFELSKVPPGYEVKLLKEEVLNQSEVVTVSDELYERIKYSNWEDYDYKYGDTGETKWDLDRATTRVSHGKEIELVYRPLAYGAGDLVQGVLVRNYATCDMGYTISVISSPMEVTSSEIHDVSVPAFGSVPLQLVQLEDKGHPIFINLKYGNRIVATLQVSFGSNKPPEFWRGFWDGFASKGWGVLVTCGIMVIVGVVLPPKWAVAASLVILVVGIAMDIIEVWVDVHNALAAMDSLNEFADVCEGRAKEFNEIGMYQHANELFELAQVCRLEAKEIDGNLLFNVFSELGPNVSWDEIRMAFGLKEPPLTRDRDYRVGYATGRVVGAIVSCAAYVATFRAVVNKIKAERIDGKPLSIKQVLRFVGAGIYRWITPPIWDAMVLVMERAGTKFFGKVVDLVLGSKYGSRFSGTVEGMIRGINDPPRIEDVLESSSGLSKHVLDNVPSKESSGKILDAIGSIIEHYSLDELKGKGGTIARGIVSMWIKDGDEAIDNLNGWLSKNINNIGEMRVLEEVLFRVGGDAAKGVGLRIGDIVDNYLEIKSKYGKDIAEAFLNTVLGNPNALGEFLAGTKVFDFQAKPHSITLKGGHAPIHMGKGNELDPGTYMARISWKYEEGGKSIEGMVQFPIRKDVRSDEVAIPKDCVNQILTKIGEDKATVYITKAEFFDYRLFFPKEFSVGGEGISIDLFFNEMKIGDRIYRYKQDTNIGEKGLYVNAEFEGKNIRGKNLVLTFYQDGRVEIRYGENSYPINKISVDISLELMTIKYEGYDKVIHEAEYSFNLNPLSAQMELSYEIPAEEGRMRLKECLFRLLGYDALKEFESRIMDVDEDRGVVLSVYFDNNKVACCGNDKFRVHVPSGANKITKMEIVPLKELSDPKKCAAKVLRDPESTKLKGGLGEAIVRSEFMDWILTWISSKTGIPKDKLVVIPRGGDGEPDFEVKVSDTGKRVAVIEAKYVWDPENVEEFKDQLNDAIRQINNRFSDPDWTAPHGVIVVIAWPPQDILDDIQYPPKVGDYNNPYIGYFERGG